MKYLPERSRLQRGKSATKREVCHKERIPPTVPIINIEDRTKLCYYKTSVFKEVIERK